MKVKKKKEFSYIIRGVDPNTIWSLVGELGDGSFGKVYKAERKTDGALAAAKIIEVKEESELDDFMVEIDILSECKHSHVVGMYEAYYHENKLWMMLEFCSGGALDDLILELERGLTEDQIRIACKQMFECLHFLHTHKVIHRDLKAGNLLLTGDGNIKLADFGVSAKNKKTVQRRTTFIGTPYWMAPEVIVTETCKDDPYDFKADIWSAGITLIELAEMQPPYHDMHPMRVLFKIPKADPPQLQFKNRWSKDFHDFLSHCVVKSPEMRSSAGDLLEHPFIANVADNKPLKELYNEAKAVVIEELEDLPEDKEEKGEEKRELKTSESTGSLNESAEWNKEIEKEKEEGEEEIEENKDKEKDVENDEVISNKNEESKEMKEEEKETMEVKVEEKEETEKMEERKESEQVEEEKEKEKGEETVEKKEDLESESQEKGEEAREDTGEDTGKEDDGRRTEEKEEKAAVDEKPEEVDGTTEEIAEETKRVSKEPEEEAIAASEEAEDKTVEGGDTAEEIEDKTKEGEKRDEQEGQALEETASSVIDKEEQDREKETSEAVDSGTKVSSGKKETVPLEEEDKKPQVLLGDKYSTRLDNILDQLEGDEQVESLPTEEQKAESSEETIEAQDSKDKDEEKLALLQDKEHVVSVGEEDKGKVDKPDENEKIDHEKGKMASENSIKNDAEEREETKCEDKEDDVFDVSEEASIPNGNVLPPVLINDKDPTSDTEKKAETTDGPDEEKHFKTLKRIRKFEKDGKIVTETTSRVVDVSQEDYRNALMKEKQQRKFNLRELKILQREEQKQGMLLMAKIRRQWDAQEQRFEQELQDLDKKYDVDLDNLSRNQKKEIEKLEITQNADLRTSSRKMKQDQEKDLRRFKDSLREEHKSAKKEVDALPRNQRKEAWRKRKEEMEVSQRQAEHEFLAMQQVEFEKFCKELIELHRERMYNLEMQFLQDKHQLKRGHEGERWEIEQRQLHERHQLARTQLKETFFLQRSQMVNRHEKECEQHTRLTKLKEEEMKRRHEIERKRLPKIQRDEIKAKSQQYRKSLRIDKTVSVDVEREMIKEFDLLERKKARSEYEKMLFRQEMEAEELRVSTESALKELRQLQNEKRHMLMESETMKLKERDEKHQVQLVAWKAELVPRKKTLEEEFAREEREQQLFYARNLSEFPRSDSKEFDGDTGENQVDGYKTPEDNVSSKSSSGST